jgi:uncharacterized protein YerC
MKVRQPNEVLRAKIAKLLREGLSGPVIEERLGCSHNTVCQVRKKMREEQGSKP